MRREMPGLPGRVTTAEAANRHLPGAAAADPSHRLDRTDRPSSRQASARFPLAREGYDRAIVDQRFAELEQEVVELDRELADLRGPAPLKGEVAAEIDRIGKQVSAILIAAHESANETRRRAEAEAEDLIAYAERRVRTITEDANRELRRLQDEIASVRSERERLLDDTRKIADGLRALADKSLEDSSSGGVERCPDAAEGKPATAET
jgi:vacuolar-type H+-ATPase subunit H